MAHVSQLQANALSGFNTDNIKWSHLEGGPEFDYQIDYWIAILGAQPEKGRVDFLGRWEPNAYCHYHRHLGETTTIVLEGEHHLVETTATRTIHKTRRSGDYSVSPYGEYHMEYAGPEGSVLFFSMQCPDENLFEILDREDNVIGTVTITDFVAGNF